eukprot:Selendium_serpulae@DN5815_c0_g2_i1.p1
MADTDCTMGLDTIDPKRKRITIVRGKRQPQKPQPQKPQPQKPQPQKPKAAPVKKTVKGRATAKTDAKKIAASLPATPDTQVTETTNATDSSSTLLQCDLMTDEDPVQTIVYFDSSDEVTPMFKKGMSLKRKNQPTFCRSTFCRSTDDMFKVINHQFVYYDQETRFSPFGTTKFTAL